MICSDATVFKAPSKIVACNSNFKTGYGLFSNVNLLKNQHVCSFSGKLVDCADAKYMDPTYMFSWQLGKGFKLIADDLDGNLGHFANSVHPDTPFIEQNARINKKSLRKTKSNKYLLMKRIKIDIVASRDILKGEEIIIDYGSGYWNTMEHFVKSGIKIKPLSVQLRDERTKHRESNKN